MKRLHPLLLLSLVSGLLSLPGCSQEAPPAPAGPSVSDSVEVDGSQFILSEEPEGAVEVIAAREASEDGDDVVLVGRIGGGLNPWIEGRAAFSIVDNSLKACSDIPGDKCPKPWDYCCETDRLAEATTLVKIVDSDGELVAQDARKLLGLRELQTVVIRGRAVRDDVGNLTILAAGLFVQP